MKHRNKAAKRIVAGLLTTAYCLPIAVEAAPPSVETDEAVYVNLDYYGTLSDMRVVKGVSLNGQTNFVDYGHYDSVINMTSYDKPTLAEDSVTWDLKDPEKQRFYYECIPNNLEEMQMPWNFDVSYKLDGVTTAAEDLAGASGVVEITVKATPNEQAREYYKNNMALIVGQGIDMSKSLSIDAPDAQVQSMGTYKMVMFMALPGEEQTFTTRIGSDSFEYFGTFMMMAPLTSSELERIEDLRDAKDDLRSAGDDMYVGVSAMLDTMNSLKGGMSAISGGLSGLDRAREQLKAANETDDASVDQALTDLQTMIDELDSTLPEMENTITTLESLNETTNSTLNILKASQGDIGVYQKNLQQLKKDMQQIVSMIDDVNEVTYGSGDYDWVLKNMHSSLGDMVTTSRDLEKELDSLRDNLKELNSSSMQAQLEYLQGVAEETGDYGLLLQVQQMQSLLELLSPGMFTDLADLMAAVSTLSGAMNSALTLVDEYVDALEDHTSDVSAMINTLQKILTVANSTLDTIDSTLDMIPAFQTELDTITEDTQSVLSKLISLIPKSKQALSSTKQSVETLRNTLLSVREQANDSTKQTIDGMLDVLQKTVNSTATDKVQTAADSIYDTTKKELDEWEDDTNVFNIDSSLDLQSCTSLENPTPTSLQFIVRTEEISLDTVEDTVTQEPETADEGVWARIVRIFTKIAQALQAVFQSES